MHRGCAWVVVLLVPLLVLMFLKIHRHYIEVAKQLSTEGLGQLRPFHHEVIVPISGIHRGVIEALEYAKSIAPHHVTAVYVNLDDEAAQKLREKSCSVFVSAKSAGKKVEAHWTFGIEEGAAARPAATTATRKR